MRALVFGAGGQAGRALVKACPPGVTLLALGREDCDVVCTEAVRRAIQAFAPDVVFNMAAFTDVDRAESETELARAANAQAPGAMAACARECGARMVHISTDYVFDGTASQPYRPQDAGNPVNAYGRSKLEGELRVMEAAPDALVVRTAWLYARDGRNFVNTILRLVARDGAVRIVDDQIGSPTSANSLAAALWRLVRAGARGVHHYTDAGVASWYDLGAAVAEEAAALGLADRPGQVVPIASSQFPTVARRPAYTVLDKSATWEVLGGSAPHWRVSLRAVLEETTASG